MNKRGQYYLVAAMVFIGIIFMIITTVNYSKKEVNTKVYDLKKELEIESSKVLEYYAYTGTNKIEDFSKRYSDYAGSDTNIYFITGNKTTQEVYNYTNGNKTILTKVTFDPLESTLNTTIEGRNYYFDFQKGQNFYFIIIQKDNGEEYVLVG